MCCWLTTSNSGIIGSIEFLQDTAIDPFQASMISTVETCGKTLLDTANSILEISKMSKGSVKKQHRRLGSKETSALAHVEDIDLATTIEEVV
jgi:signal transduction histidine kinase